MIKIIFTIIMPLIIVSCAYKYINQLEIGMTKEQVIAIMGPEYIKAAGSVANDGSPVEIYIYGFIDDIYYLGFKNGRLVLWMPKSAYNNKPDLSIEIIK